MTPPISPGADNKTKVATVVADNKAKAGAAAAKRQPPEEQFWKHYSPHHEFPLSSVTSVGLHILIIVLLALAGWVAFKLGWDENKPPEVSAVVVDAGGGGNPEGVKGGVEGGGPAASEDVKEPSDPTKPPSVDDVKVPDVGEADPLTLPQVTDNSGKKLVEASSQAIKNLASVDTEARKKLFSAVGDKGRGGPGTGGGKGTGHGEGVGTGTGEGKGLSKRQKRVLRWSMTFNTENGDDYARQLAGIKPGGGAILAVPVGGGQYEVLRDLRQRPARGKVEDLATIKSIFWVDDKPDSVSGLAHALQIKVPQYFVAFFPPDLEEELARLERQKAGGGVSEDDIEETRFNVVRSPDGSFRPNCISVRLKGR
jgi:hypothetical protein